MRHEPLSSPTTIAALPDVRDDNRRLWFVLLAVITAHAFVTALFWSWLPLSGWAPQLFSSSVVLLTLIVPAFWFGIYRPITRSFATAREGARRDLDALQERLRVHDLDVRLTAALNIAEDETAVLRIAHQALAIATDGAPAQLLLADSSDGQIRHSLVVGNLGDDARCVINRPCDCPLVRRGMGTVFEDSMVLSACRGLNGPIAADCAAACTPITVSGNGVGMVRALGTSGDPTLYRLLQSLNTAAHHIGSRLSVIRSMAASERKAATDPLTGAANRRSAEQRLDELVHSGGSYAVVMIDIDHFKLVNDRHGHEVGDRALKLLVGTMRPLMRGEDLLCRYGGEEFLLVLPSADAVAAGELMQRVRNALPGACVHDGVPVFTISAGIASERNGSNPQVQLRAADQALYQAKRDGRDRVVLAPVPESRMLATP
ncbi:MAG: diguanylate cyclase [Rhodanobacteraceae bacterium]|nr:diguanylate cyclase [Rhodanobacteraceae bacterium]